jgi:hypothetical protein
MNAINEVKNAKGQGEHGKNSSGLGPDGDLTQNFREKGRERLGSGRMMFEKCL